MSMFEKNAFPAIANLPDHLVATDWTWSRPKPSHNRPNGLKASWWVATDNTGRRWVVKMTGSNYAYREHVFAALAHRLGISCQSSMYLTIPRNAIPMLNAPKPESHQLALCFFDEHQNSCSSENCPLNILKGLHIGNEANLQTFLSCGVSRAVDWIRGEILGYLCGQFEPPGRLFTVDHELVQIDNELMFASGPLNPEDCRWLQYRIGRQCAENMCSILSEISDEELLSLAEIPSGYTVPRKNNVPRRLLAARRAAKKYLDRVNKAKITALPTFAHPFNGDDATP
jgi:hypothetical protein